MPKVSVILTSYNHEMYIAGAIQSVLDQTFADFELLICDDGSQDRSQEIIRSFHDNRIRFFLFSKNRGACISTREVEQNVRGEYIAIQHSDDVWEPDKLAKQVAFLDSHSLEYGAVFSYVQIIDDYGMEFQQPDHFYSKVFIQKNRTRQEWLRHFFYEGNCLCHPSVLIRRECYEELGMYDERFSQVPDLDFWIRLCERWEIYILPEQLVRFRVHNDESNASGSRLENTIRTNNEYLLLLQSFLGIASEEDFFLIFPEAVDLRSPKGFVLEYVLARVCLDRRLRKMYHCWGMFLLYRVMGKVQLANRIQYVYNFGVRELSFLAQQYDVFNVMEMDLFQPVLYCVEPTGTYKMLPVERVFLKNGAVQIRGSIPAGDSSCYDIVVQPLTGWPCDLSHLWARQFGRNIPIEAEPATLFRQQIMSAELCPRLHIAGHFLRAGTVDISYKVEFLTWGEVMQVYIRHIKEHLQENGQLQQKYNALACQLRQNIEQQGDLPSELSKTKSSRVYRLLQRVYRVYNFLKRRWGRNIR